MMLDKELVIQYIARPDMLSGDDVRILRESLERYPFCHVSRMLYLKALYNAGRFSYPQQLARGAAFIADRKALFELVNQVEPSAFPAVGTKNELPDGREEPPQELSQWMEQERKTGRSTEDIIDRFIRTNPKIKPSRDFVPAEDLAEPAVAVLSEQVMTETLALIYVRQKKYARAMEAYRILMLKNPKKSSFFADRIKEIEKLKDKN